MGRLAGHQSRHGPFQLGYEAVAIKLTLSPFAFVASGTTQLSVSSTWPRAGRVVFSASSASIPELADTSHARAARKLLAPTGGGSAGPTEAPAPRVEPQPLPPSPPPKNNSFGGSALNNNVAFVGGRSLFFAAAATNPYACLCICVINCIVCATMACRIECKITCVQHWYVSDPHNACSET